MAPEVRLVQSPLGYFEVNPKPSPEELAAYYADRYYSAGRERSQYAYAYTPDELEHHRLVADETLRYVGSGPGRVYEVGFGEGFALAAFQDHGWDVGGIDFTSDGLETHNPALRDRVDIGDVFEELDRLTGSGRQFDVVLCNNVLEHVLDPERLATSLLGLVAPAGICRIVVPNDGSFLQREIVRRGYAEPDFWVRYPDHLNYFTVESLAAVLTASGWEIVDLLGSFPPATTSRCANAAGTVTSRASPSSSRSRSGGWTRS